MHDTERPGCVKFGCFGCGAMVAAAGILVAVLAMARVAYESAEPEVADREIEHELPTPPASPVAMAGEAGSPRMLERADLESPEFTAVETGRIVLDLSVGEFFITPGPAGDPIRLEAEFDSRAFELVENLTTSESGWTYEVSFGTRGGWLASLLRGGADSENRLELVIPRGHPVDLVGTIGVGTGEVELGGLWLRTVDLDLGTGEHAVYFREPTPLPMQSFRIDKGVGELQIYDLGEGSPAAVTVEQRVGALRLSLEGAWADDADVEVDFGVGECRIDLPEGARIEIDESRVAIGERNIDLPDQGLLPPDAPTVSVRVTSKIGEVQIR